MIVQDEQEAKAWKHANTTQYWVVLTCFNHSPEAWRCITTWVFPNIMVTPKSSILIGCSILNHPFWGTPIFGNTHMFLREATFSHKLLLASAGLLEGGQIIGWLKIELINLQAENENLPVTLKKVGWLEMVGWLVGWRCLFWGMNFFSRWFFC